MDGSLHNNQTDAANPPAGRTRARRWLWTASAVVLAGAVFGMLLVPLPSLGRVTQSVSNVLHAPAFGLLAIVCWIALRRGFGLSPVRAACVAWMGVVGFGAAGEWAQQWVDRDPGWNDALANALGATAGLAWGFGLSRAFRGTRFAWCAAGTILLISASWPSLCVFYDAVLQQGELPTLASFEHELELLRWSVREADIRRVPAHATAGQWSLQVDMTTGKYPGVAMRWPPADWSIYSELVFDVSVDAPPNPESFREAGLLNLIVKIHDVQHNGRKYDRFHQLLRLEPGRHECRIRLSDVERAPRDRRLDLKHVALLQIYTARPEIPRTIYLDNIRLESIHLDNIRLK